MEFCQKELPKMKNYSIKITKFHNLKSFKLNFLNIIKYTNNDLQDNIWSEIFYFKCTNELIQH